MSKNLKTMLPDYLESLGLSTDKPFNCLSPEHEDKTPSMSYDRKHSRVKCFGCGATWDLYDLIAVEELNAPVDDDGKPHYDFKTAKRTAQQLLTGSNNLDTPSNRREGVKQSVKDQKGIIYQEKTKSAQNGSQRKIRGNDKKELNKQRAALIEMSQNSLSQDFNSFSEATRERLKPFRTKAVKYLNSRGISLRTAQKANLGYADKWRSQTALANGKNPAPSPRIIIPTSKASYVARYCGEAPEGSPKKLKEGKAHFFNGQALLKNGSTFVVEGEFDALSVMEVGYQAVALGSTEMVKQFVAAVKWAKEQRQDYHPTLLLALDNDTAGQRATRKLTTELQRLNINHYVVQIARGCKDANGALQGNRETFKSDVANVVQNPDNRLQRWMDIFKHGSQQQAIPTGFEKLDEVLDGGLYEGLYGLGAISSLGKTTLALQIADHIAESGKPVLYFALEMGWEEMTSKSISRLTAINELAANQNYDQHLAQTTRSLQNGWEHYNKAQKDNLYKAIGQYAKYAGRLLYRDGKEQRPSANDVATTVDNFVARTGEQPVVVVDYLQLLAPVDPRATDKSAVTTSANLLKKIATRHHVPVIMISSFNRQKYNQPASMESFKESGDIEYSADVLIGLQPKGIDDDGFDINKAKQADPRGVEAVILKNRNGRTGDVIGFNYSPAFNLFTGDDNQLPPFNADETTPKIDQQGRLTGTQQFYGDKTYEQVTRGFDTEGQAEQETFLPATDQGDGPAVLKGPGPEVYGQSGRWYTSAEACRAAGDEPVELPF